MHQWLRRAAFAAAGISCGFTAYFGWTTGGDDTFAKVFNAAAGGLISLAVPLFFLLVGLAEHRRKAVAMYAFAAFGVLFGLLDAGSNVGSLFAMRESSIIRAAHETVVAQDVRERVARLRADDAKYAAVIGQPGAWMSVEDAEKALERTIAARDREADRVKCGPRCEALDLQARELRLEIAKARTREEAIVKRAEVQRQLVEAEALAIETPPAVSPVETIKAKLGSVFSFDLKPGEEIRELTYLAITMAFGVGLTLLSGALGYGATWMQPHQHASEHDSWAPRPAIAAAPEYRPQPLQAEPAHRSSHSSETTVIYAAGTDAPRSYDRLQAHIDRLRAASRSVET